MRKLFLVLLLLSSRVLAGDVYHYEPEEVVLSGKIERQTFPGPPGYESIGKGDEIERGWYLRLHQAIRVEVGKNNSDGNAQPEKNVRILHLTWNYEAKKIDASIQKSVGKQVTLKGHLFHAFSGHHHARVLMWVDEARENRE